MPRRRHRGGRRRAPARQNSYKWIYKWGVVAFIVGIVVNLIYKSRRSKASDEGLSYEPGGGQVEPPATTQMRVLGAPVAPQAQSGVRQKTLQLQPVPLKDKEAKRLIKKNYPAETRRVIWEHRKNDPLFDMVIQVVGMEVSPPSHGAGQAGTATDCSVVPALISSGVLRQGIQKAMPHLKRDAIVHEFEHDKYGLCAILNSKNGDNCFQFPAVLYDLFMPVIEKILNFLDKASRKQLDQGERRLVRSFNRYYSEKYGDNPYMMYVSPVRLQRFFEVGEIVNMRELLDVYADYFRMVMTRPIGAYRYPEFRIVEDPNVNALGMIIPMFQAKSSQDNFIAALFFVLSRTILYLPDNAKTLVDAGYDSTSDIFRNTLFIHLLTELLAVSTQIPRKFWEEIAPELVAMKKQYEQQCVATFNRLERSGRLLEKAIEKGKGEFDGIEVMRPAMLDETASFSTQTQLFSDPNATCTATSTGISCRLTDATGLQGIEASIELKGDAQTVVSKTPLSFELISLDSYNVKKCEVDGTKLSCTGDKAVVELQSFSASYSKVLVDGVVKGFGMGIFWGLLNLAAKCLIEQVVSLIFKLSHKCGVRIDNEHQGIVSQLIYYGLMVLFVPEAFLVTATLIGLRCLQFALKNSLFSRMFPDESLLLGVINVVKLFCRSDLSSWSAALVHTLAQDFGSSLGFWAVTTLQSYYSQSREASDLRAGFWANKGGRNHFVTTGSDTDLQERIQNA